MKPRDHSTNVSSNSRTRLLSVGTAPKAISGWTRAKKKFLKVFPGGFRDETYLAWERDYKWEAHREWQAQLSTRQFTKLCDEGDYLAVAATAVRIEAGRSLLFSFEKMALRDAVRGEAGARAFAEGIRAFLHGDGDMEHRFENWCDVVARLPRKQTRVLTWPLATVFGFIAQPDQHIFLKPLAMKRAAAKLRWDLQYRSRPNWTTYSRFLRLADEIRTKLPKLRPRDMIDLQSFLWVQGSDEYA